MNKILVILSFLFFYNSLNAQIIILKDCFNPNKPKDERAVKTREIILNLKNKTISFQGISKEGKPYVSINETHEKQSAYGSTSFKIEATSGGFIKATGLKIIRMTETETRTIGTEDIFDLNTLIVSFTRTMDGQIMSEKLIQCQSINGKTINNSKKKSNNSDSKSLLKKLLKK